MSQASEGWHVPKLAAKNISIKPTIMRQVKGALKNQDQRNQK